MAHGRPDFSPTAVDVVLRPEWAAKEGTDKTFTDREGSKNFLDYIEINYTVPGGKTLYLNSASFGVIADDAANFDHNIRAELTLVSYKLGVGSAVFADLSGPGGFLSLPKPGVVEAGYTLQIILTNYTDFSCTLGVAVQGYEV